MSDETASAPENPVVPPTGSVPRAKKASTPRPKKVAKKVATIDAVAPTVIETATVPVPAPPAPVLERQESIEPSAPTDGEWPEPDAATAGGGGSPSESTKRKRRRRKGKGQNSAAQNAVGTVTEEVTLQGEAVELKPVETFQDPRPPRPNPPPQSHPQSTPRSKVDPELLTKMAWKIYLAEVSEEGVALIGDNDAKDLSRRCFRLAEIFVEEQLRRR